MRRVQRAAIVVMAVSGVTAATMTIAEAAPPKRSETFRVSMTTAGTDLDRWSGIPAVSHDGRYVAYFTLASNVEPGRDSTLGVVYHDTVERKTTFIANTWDGFEQNSGTHQISMSADGRFVVFDSDAELVPGEPQVEDEESNVYLWDRDTGQLTQISQGIKGAVPNGSSFFPDISADGQLVVFSSTASNLVPKDTNGALDVFVHNRETGKTTRVSVGSAGEQAHGDSWQGRISGNGKFVVFSSDADNLGGGATNRQTHVFLHALKGKRTQRISVGGAGAPDVRYWMTPHISATGRYITYASDASNIVPDDTPRTQDLFVYDRKEDTTIRIPTPAGHVSYPTSPSNARLSANGNLISFETMIRSDGDRHGTSTVFVYDRVAGSSERVSAASDGTPAAGFSEDAAISGNGQVVVYSSSASNLAPGDTNEARDVFRSPARRTPRKK